MYDVIIVGASPSGLVTARECSKNDLETLIIEKRGDFSNPRLADTSFYGFFNFLGLEVDEKFVRHEVEGMRIISPLGSELKINERGFSLDRKKFSKHYLERAQKFGAEILFDSKVTDIEGDSVFLDSGEKIDAKVIVLAMGSRSDLFNNIDIKTMKYPEDVAKAIQAEVRNVDVGTDYFHYYLGKEVAPGWKCAINPKGENFFSVGAFVRGEKPDKYFKKFLERDIFDGAKVLNERRGEDQIVTIPNELVRDNLVAIGGSGGQAGVPFSMKAGELCGKVISNSFDNGSLNKENLVSYEEEWKKRYNKYYKLARFSLNVIREMSNQDLDKALNSLKNEDISSIFNKYDSTISKGTIIGLKMFKNDPSIFKLIKYLI